jgi:hypothetical protein
MGRTMKKEKSQKVHAQQRCKERYGLTLGRKTYDILCVKLREQGEDCIFLEKQSNRVSFFAIKHEEEWIPVIYDKMRHTIVTFLPKEALEPHKDKLI